jgi:hypothetical protein
MSPEGATISVSADDLVAPSGLKTHKYQPGAMPQAGISLRRWRVGNHEARSGAKNPLWQEEVSF